MMTQVHELIEKADNFMHEYRSELKLQSVYYSVQGYCVRAQSVGRADGCEIATKYPNAVDAKKQMTQMNVF